MIGFILTRYLCDIWCDGEMYDKEVMHVCERRDEHEEISMLCYSIDASRFHIVIGFGVAVSTAQNKLNLGANRPF